MLVYIIFIFFFLQGEPEDVNLIDVDIEKERQKFAEQKAEQRAKASYEQVACNYF